MFLIDFFVNFFHSYPCIPIQDFFGWENVSKIFVVCKGLTKLSSAISDDIP